MSELVRVSVDPFLGLGDLEDDNVLLHKVITALTLARNSVPAEYRDGSIFKMDRDCDYETGYGAPTFTVEYWRPETSEEIARREAESADREARRAHEVEQNQRIMYEALKFKFELAHRAKKTEGAKDE